MMDVLVARSRLVQWRALSLLILALMLCLLMLNHYWLGMYSRVLAFLATPWVLVIAAAAIWMDALRERQAWVCMLALQSLVIPLLWLMADDLLLSLYGLLMVPFLSCLLLEQRMASRFNGLVCAMVLLAGLLVAPWLEALRAALVYGLVVMAVAAMVSTLLRWHTLMQSLMLHDPVSGACNARHFSVVLGREVARSQHARRPLSLIGLSLEDLGQFHHLHGSAQVGRTVADLVIGVRQEVRAGDDVFRLRDDLFVLLLPDCPEDGAIVLMERIKRQLEQGPVPATNELGLAVATVTLVADEAAVELERRLLKRLAKQRRANLQAAAFVNG